MNSVLLIAVLVLGILHASLWIIAVTFISTRLLGIVVAARSAKDIFTISSFRFALVNKETFYRINIFGLYGIFGTILFTLDTVLISNMTNDHEVGLYQSVIKLVSLGLLFSDVLVFSVLPSLSRKYDSDRPQWLNLARYSHRTLVFMGTFVSFFLIVFPSDILTIVYGTNRFDAAAPIIRLFGWIVAIRYFSEAGGLILTSSHQQARRLTVVVLATVINLCANLIVIPRYGIRGAAMISLMTNVFVGIGYLWYGGTFRNIWAMELTHCVPLVIAVCLGIFFWSGTSLSVWISLPLSAVALLLSIFLFGYNKVDRYKLISWGDSR